MYNWNYVPDHPFSLTLAADHRFTTVDYANDHIWQLRLGSADPPAIALETTFGLRARLCRIFPRFMCNNQEISDPNQFSHPIIIHKYLPAYIELSFKPFSCINVKLEYWVPTSQVIACRVKIINTSHEPQQIQLEWSELLLPSSDGTPISEGEIGMNKILTGRTSNLFPVLFLTGGARSGKSPFPTLNLSNTIQPRDEFTMQWVHASLADTYSSFELAKEVIARNWDAEFARLARECSNSLEIHTGNKDWDTAFMLSQNIAHQLILRPLSAQESRSTVMVRSPDQGYSLREDGTDYGYAWNGQTPLDLLYFTNFLLPSSPELLSAFLNNFINTQTTNGHIDSKPGLAGQRSRLLAAPVIAYVALQIYEQVSNFDFLKEIFPKLLAFFYAWFSPEHDRDADMVPEWEQTSQTGFDDLPLFSYHQPWSAGVDIFSVESPDLCTYLYQECHSLIKIAKILGDIASYNQLTQYSMHLKQAVEQLWSDQQACYQYRDRDSHNSLPSEYLGDVIGPGTIELNRSFEQPIRPVFQVELSKETTAYAELFIHGTGLSSAHRVEHVSTRQIHWQHQRGVFTSEHAYTMIERIEITGIRSGDTVRALTADLTSPDQSCMLPLWAKIPPNDRAKVLINLTVMNKKKFLGPFGLRTCLSYPGITAATDGFSVNHLPWTSLVLEGLIHYGERKKATEIFTRLMKPVVISLQSDLTMHQSFDEKTGRTFGAENSLYSLVPIGLFLKILGVRIINPEKVEISGHNPFPWAVTIKYQGLVVVKQEKKTLVIFPNGTSTTLNNDHSQVVSSEKSME